MKLSTNVKLLLICISCMKALSKFPLGNRSQTGYDETASLVQLYIF